MMPLSSSQLCGCSPPPAGLKCGGRRRHTWPELEGPAQVLLNDVAWLCSSLMPPTTAMRWHPLTPPSLTGESRRWWSKISPRTTYSLVFIRVTLRIKRFRNPVGGSKLANGGIQWLQVKHRICSIGRGTPHCTAAPAWQSKLPAICLHFSLLLIRCLHGQHK